MIESRQTSEACLQKTCSKCRTPKPPQSFHRNRTSKDGRCHWCIDCDNDKYHRNKRGYSLHLKRQYGIDTVDVNELREKQRNKCAICGNCRPLCVDHDHMTGRIRGLLCRTCNSKLGWFERHRDTIQSHLGAEDAAGNDSR